ncbi:hypothetical protein [uncultured Enterovirga sp.]|uniref:hypothetical protein n=1 Tax=uncultured Enterovirga sp. TaxID=2026352 RepID=UPI0035CAF77D
MRALRRRATAVARLAIGLALSGGGAASGQPSSFETAGLSVAVSLADADGRPIPNAEVDQPFWVRLRFSEASGAAIKPGLSPAAWLRRSGIGRSACQDAGRAARATGRLPSDSVPLAGLSVVTLDGENRIATVDPHRPSSARIVSSIVPIGERPAAMVVHPGLGELLVSRPERGDVLAIPLPWGRATVRAAGLGRPGVILPSSSGRMWVEDTSGDRALLLDRAGGIVSEARIAALRLIEAGPDRVLATGADGGARLLDRATGEEVGSYPPRSLSTVVAATRESVLTTRGGRLIRRYGDAPLAAEPIDVPGDVQGLALDGAGRWAVAWSRVQSGRVELSVVDLVRGRRVHGFEAADVVDEALILGDVVFLTWPTRAVVTVVDLAALGSGDAAVREVRLSEPDLAEPATRTGKLMVPLSPLSAVAVMRPGGKTLHTVVGGGGLASAPVGAITLKGAPPAAITAFPRSLVEIEDGVFESSARLPRGGGWELVVTTGVGGTTACLPIAATDEAEPPLPASISAEVEGALGQNSVLAVRLRHWTRAPEPTSLTLRLSALNGGVSRDLEARLGPDGLFRTAPFDVAPAPYVVSPIRMPIAIRPAFIDLTRRRSATGGQP